MGGAEEAAGWQGGWEQFASSCGDLRWWPKPPELVLLPAPGGQALIRHAMSAALAGCTRAWAGRGSRIAETWWRWSLWELVCPLPWTRDLQANVESRSAGGMGEGSTVVDDLLSRALGELPVLVRACRLLEAAKSGADEDVSRALAAPTEAAVSASGVVSALGAASCYRRTGEGEDVGPGYGFPWCS